MQTFLFKLLGHLDGLGSTYTMKVNESDSNMQFSAPAEEIKFINLTIGERLSVYSFNEFFPAVPEPSKSAHLCTIASWKDWKWIEAFNISRFVEK